MNCAFPKGIAEVVTGFPFSFFAPLKRAVLLSLEG